MLRLNGSINWYHLRAFFQLCSFVVYESPYPSAVFRCRRIINVGIGKSLHHLHSETVPQVSLSFDTAARANFYLLNLASLSLCHSAASRVHHLAGVRVRTIAQGTYSEISRMDLGTHRPRLFVATAVGGYGC